MNRIFLDGTEYTANAIGLDDIDSILYKLNDNGSTVQKSVSTEITFYGDAYDYLFGIFFADLTPLNAPPLVDVELFIDCCDQSVNYTIGRESVVMCPNGCGIEANLEKVNVDTLGYEYLSRTRILDNDAVNNIQIPHVEYCTGSGFRGAGAVLFVILNAIFNIINTIVNIIDILYPGNIPDPLPPELIDDLLGCDKKAPSFHLRQALELQTGIGGLSLQTTSTLDLDNYINTCILPMQFLESENDYPDFETLLENRPNLTVIQMLDRVEPLFNAQTRVRNGVLMFETQEYFDSILVNAGNVEDLDFAGFESVCYLFDEARFPSYGRYSYGYDAVDDYGMLLNYIYNDIVEWNPSGNAEQKGEKTVIAENFSPLNFMGTRPTYFDPNNNLAFLYDHAVVRDGIAEKFKIYAWDGLQLHKAKPLRVAGAFGNVNHNYPFFFPSVISNFPETVPTLHGLYYHFHEVDDPNNFTQYPLKTNDFTFRPNNFCEFVQLLETEGTDIYLDSPFGRITPNAVDVDFTQQSITFQDTKILEYT